MNKYLLILIILGYLVFLFLLAYWAEKRKKDTLRKNPYIYVLSLAIYCSAWTYYGSVGIAYSSGPRFLTIYLGPVIAMPLWIVIMRKIIVIVKQHKISSIADFIALRYGNNRSLGALVTITCLLGVIPYIALQLKALSETFSLISNNGEGSAIGVFGDSTFYIALLIAIFVAFLGTRSADASKGRTGIMATIAFESILKLAFFLLLGIYVVYILFDGTSDLYQKALAHGIIDDLPSFGGLEAGFNWMFTILMSFFAIFLLPRQFHVSVVENQDVAHLRKAIWLFPLYLLCFNVFVIFIAWAGALEFSGSFNPDYFSLLLPLKQGNTFVALMVFMGGLSAVISMIVVSALALSTMVSNNIIIPYGFVKKLGEGTPKANERSIKIIRRTAIFLLIITAYFFYVQFSVQLSLYSIGLVSFVIIAQLAPSFFTGLFWRRGTAKGAKFGIMVGLAVVVYTLVFPIVHASGTSHSQSAEYHAALIRPLGVFQMDYLTPESTAFLWSLTFNTLTFVGLSLTTKGNYRERNYAEMFVHHENYSDLQENAFVWKGEAYVDDIKRLLTRFLGGQKTQRALTLFNKKHNIPADQEKADSRLINFSEKLLTGSIGSSSAKILLASVSKEKPINLVEVLNILEETKEARANNKILMDKSEELSRMASELQLANEELRTQDKLKDEFLDTVAHELKTPVTSIKAASEVLEDDEMPPGLRKQFLENIRKDSDRLAKLIHDILDLEKLASKRSELNLQSGSLNATVAKAIRGIQRIAEQQGVRVQFEESKLYRGLYDEDRMLQVLTNLLSNSLKFTEDQLGIIRIVLEEKDNDIVVAVEDNGRGIPKEDFDHIFEKFYQSKKQNTQKPMGSGFGLAICKRIVEGHNGTIWADRDFKEGARLVFTIPKVL